MKSQACLIFSLDCVKLGSGRRNVSQGGDEACSMNGAVGFVFEGQFDCASFLNFARHRAGRLDLDLDVGVCSATRMALSVTGQEALVDMFEMACSLGPYDCIVHDVRRSDA